VWPMRLYVLQSLVVYLIVLDTLVGRKKSEPSPEKSESCIEVGGEMLPIPFARSTEENCVIYNYKAREC